MRVVTAPALSLMVAQRAELERVASSTSLPHRQVVQARGLLWAGEGVGNQEIARRCEVSPDAVHSPLCQPGVMHRLVRNY